MYEFTPPVLLKSRIKDQLYYVVYPELYVWLNPSSPEYELFEVSYKLPHKYNQFILILYQLGYSIVDHPQ